jgi:hypothetical protein
LGFFDEALCDAGKAEFAGFCAFFEPFRDVRGNGNGGGPKLGRSDVRERRRAANTNWRAFSHTTKFSNLVAGVLILLSEF